MEVLLMIFVSSTSFAVPVHIAYMYVSIYMAWYFVMSCDICLCIIHHVLNTERHRLF